MSKMFFGGVPTDVDVRKIKEAFPELSEGRELTHDQIEQATGIQRTENRYRTVTNAWRKAMLNEGMEIGSVSGVGFRVLRPEERINAGLNGLRSGTRKVVRSVNRALAVRTEDPVDVRKLDSMRRALVAITNAASTTMKEIEPPNPQKQMPRLVPKTGTA